MSATVPIELLCLDIAGTTVDDGTAVLDAFGAAADAVGLAGADRERGLEHARATMGQSKIEVFRSILGGDEARAAAANEAFEAAYGGFVDDGRTHPMPGAAELFAWARDRGIKVGLTTGFAPATRERIIAALGWGDVVDLRLSPADAGRGRPHPDMILTAVVRLGIGHVAAVAVAGDTRSDVESGWRAGAGIVAGVLSGTGTRDDFAGTPATHVLDSVADLRPLVEPPVLH